MLGEGISAHHTLGLHAHSFYHFPAKTLYDEIELSRNSDLFDKCHIYLIGLFPKVNFLGSQSEGAHLRQAFSILDKRFQLDWQIPEGMDPASIDPASPQILLQLYSHYGKADFSVQYIGQAYGTDGSRAALDRLIKHETLQRMAVEGVPTGYQLQVMLIEVYSATEVLTAIDPLAGDKASFDRQYRAREEKILGTTAVERIALYEASLIRYFRPKYNTIFKDHFPSTNHKILFDCYDKQFAQIAAEFTFEDMPITLSSPTIASAEKHFVLYDLRASKKRRAFFSKEQNLPSDVDALKAKTASKRQDIVEPRIILLPDQ
ncbi:hypothetical protein [Rhizobium rhizogenes]|uniref:hypothetical protein n=1 Tax=Rhizobium rhizogenes TaxID=359 RepID=UPI001571F0AB|nr:hypothetical protein [Rhizobium rhizogenes]WEO68948.1 hypothetical protein G6L54_022245 [Rhizobium rhizogenes]